MHTTQPLISQLVSHNFFLMFGQEPRLPIDFLLEKVENPVAGTVHEWVREHQIRLKITFEGAREKQRTSAGCRKAIHNKNIREAPLKDGQLVLIQNLGSKGSQNTQDLWSSVTQSFKSQQKVVQCIHWHQFMIGPELEGYITLC